jgi:diadenosine tetraphosphate (Ap4A) HIT family hydrolase
MTFKLHPRLQSDTIEIGCFSLSRLLLMNDSQYPWFILVPMRVGMTEIYQLSEQDQIVLQQESNHLARQLAEIYSADKMNIAAIGNIVSQLHIHHIVRYKHDPVWPEPVWGKLKAIPYTALKIEEIKAQLEDVLLM